MFSSTVYLINRLKNPILGNNNPFEILMKRKPDYSVIKTIGCECYPLLPKEGKNKLMPKSKKCIFLRYATQMKEYRCQTLRLKR